MTQTKKKKQKRSSSTRQAASSQSTKKKKQSSPVSLRSDYVVFFFRNLFHFLYGFLLFALLFFLVLIFMLLVESSFGVALVYHVFLGLLFTFFLASVLLFLVPEIIFMLKVYNRSYSFTTDKVMFTLGLMKKRREFVRMGDIERIEIEKKTFTDILFDTSTILIRTNISYYDPIIIPCVRQAHKKYIEMEQLLSEYTFSRDTQH